MGINRWLFGETVGLAVIFFAFAGGLTVALATSPRNVRIAHLFFALGFIWSVGCFVIWVLQAGATVKSYVLAFMVGGLILSLWLASYRWVETNHAEIASSSKPTEATGKIDVPSTTAPPKQSAAFLQLERIDVFKDFSLMATGKQLGFRVSLKNQGPILVTHPRMVVVGALSPTPNDQQYRIVIDQLQQAVRTSLARDIGSYSAPDVSVGMEVFQDFTFPPLEPGQAAGLLKGTTRIYFYIYAGWKGSDGLDGNTKMCIWLPTPQSKRLTADNVKHWNICPLPE